MIGTARDLETIEQEIWQIQAAGQAVEWRKAELYTEACAHVTVRQLATDIGKSVSYIHQIVTAWKPRPSGRRGAPCPPFVLTYGRHSSILELCN